MSMKVRLLPFEVALPKLCNILSKIPDFPTLSSSPIDGRGRYERTTGMRIKLVTQMERMPAAATIAMD